jgi:hypothetical protein
LREDPHHFRAARALEKISHPARDLPRRAIEEWSPVLVAGIALIIFCVVQISFILGAKRINGTNYALLTFGLLMFVVAGIYSPEISKLKVGTAELQKAVREQAPEPITLGIARAEVVITSVRAFAVDWAKGAKPIESEPIASAARTGVLRLKDVGLERSAVGDAAIGVEPVVKEYEASKSTS